MSNHHTVVIISRALFQTDPMNTRCKENDCFDEYDDIAADILGRLEAGESLKTALAETITTGSTTAKKPPYLSARSRRPSNG
jgi:hypothetical protein